MNSYKIDRLINKKNRILLKQKRVIDMFQHEIPFLLEKH